MEIRGRKLVDHLQFAIPNWTSMLAAVDTVIPQPQVKAKEKSKVPFRRATLERTAILGTDNTSAIATNEQQYLGEVKGTGFIYGVWLDVNTQTSGNSAAVSFTEDAPWDSLSSVILSDVSGELINLQGYDLYLTNLAMREYETQPGTEYGAPDLNGNGVAPVQEFQVTLTPASVAANTSAEQSFAAPLELASGSWIADMVLGVSRAATTPAGTAIVSYRNGGGATPLVIQFGNFTAGALTPTAATVYTVLVYRSAKGNVGGGNATTGLFQQTPGSIATGGSFRFQLRVPVAINRRDLIGLIGNQDRAQKYELRNNLAGSGTIYLTAPTALPTPTITKIYENYMVPLAQGPSGQGQDQLPPTFGTLHYVTAANLSELPSASGTITHYLKRVGNTARYMILIFRNGAQANSPRLAAEANAPTKIVFKVGEDPVFSETYQYRRKIMFDRYGFQWPAGVLIYDAMHDFSHVAGQEVGDDYYHTQSLVNSQFEISYPSGWSGTCSLRVITDDMAFSPPQQVVAS